MLKSREKAVGWSLESEPNPHKLRIWFYFACMVAAAGWCTAIILGAALAEERKGGQINHHAIEKFEPGWIEIVGNDQLSRWFIRNDKVGLIQEIVDDENAKTLGYRTRIKVFGDSVYTNQTIEGLKDIIRESPEKVEP